MNLGTHALTFFLLTSCTFLTAQTDDFQITVELRKPTADRYHVFFLTDIKGDLLTETYIIPPDSIGLFMLQLPERPQRCDLNIIKIEPEQYQGASSNNRQSFSAVTFTDLSDEAYIPFPRDTFTSVWPKEGTYQYALEIENPKQVSPDLVSFGPYYPSGPAHRQGRFSSGFLTDLPFELHDYNYHFFGLKGKTPTHGVLHRRNGATMDNIDIEQLEPLSTYTIKTDQLEPPFSLNFRFYHPISDFWQLLPVFPNKSKKKYSVALPKNLKGDSVRITYLSPNSWKKGDSAYKQRYAWIFAEMPERLLPYPFEYQYEWFADSVFWMQAPPDNVQTFELDVQFPRRSSRDDETFKLTNRWMVYGTTAGGAVYWRLPRLPSSVLQQFPVLEKVQRPKFAQFAFHHLPRFLPGLAQRRPYFYHGEWLQNFRTGAYYRNMRYSVYTDIILMAAD